MEIIKFNDFMGKKHEIIGLTQQEQHVADTLKYLLYMLVIIACVKVGLPAIPIAKTAFLYM